MGVFSSTGNVIAQSSDPGPLGAGAIWSKTNANITLRRNDANTGWVTFLPVGTIIPWGPDAGDLPSGLLLCDGSAVSKTTYANLFNLIGVRFGDPGGGNFNLPNLKGANRFLRGAANDAAVGDVGGESEVTLTGPESGIQQHSHQQRAHSTGSAVEASFIAGQPNATPINFGPTTDDAGPTDAAQAHENKPPYLDLNFAIAY